MDFPDGAALFGDKAQGVVIKVSSWNVAKAMADADEENQQIKMTSPPLGCECKKKVRAETGASIK